MTPEPEYPGVYLEEIRPAHTITGVPTSTAGFVGRAWRGPLDAALEVRSFTDYERIFGGLWLASTMGYAVEQFFTNGGERAVIVRVATRSGSGRAAPATIDVGGSLTLEAASPGTWGRNLQVGIATSPGEEDSGLFECTIVDDPATAADSMHRGGSGAREVFAKLSVDARSPDFVTSVLAERSALVRVSGAITSAPAAGTYQADAASGADGVSTLTAADAAAEVDGDETARTGLYALLETDIFNLLCIPPLTLADTPNELPQNVADVPMATLIAAAALCKRRRAVLLIDAPRSWSDDPSVMADQFQAVERSNAALYVPWLRAADPLRGGAVRDFAPCGAVAGVIGRTDAERGVWSTPAGADAVLRGVLGLSTDEGPWSHTRGADRPASHPRDDERLAALGVNTIRELPQVGPVVWGARTLDTSGEWKYVPVRRLALYLEESLYRGTQWVVFEPNDEPLWARIRLSVGAFLHGLFRRGAFRGGTPREAFFVKCDRETMTQSDIDRGIVNIVVGFAPLRPAEFVIISIRQVSDASRRCRAD